jgi:hypothetical protein
VKPSIEDQLQGTCRVLETVVAPHVAEPFARSILDGLIANLRMLTDAIPAVPRFLRQDNQATADLLASLQASLMDDLNASVTRLGNEPEPDVADIDALDDRNRQLRDILAKAACSESLSPEQHRAIIQHMSDRASRMPMRYVANAPTPAKETT